MRRGFGLLVPRRGSWQGGDDGVAAQGGKVFEEGLEAVHGGVFRGAFGFGSGLGGS